MEPYVKDTVEFFPDYCNQVIHGVNNFGDAFRIESPNIIQNPLSWGNHLSGFKNPDWKRLIREGLSATTTLIASESAIVFANRCKTAISTSNVAGSYPGNYTSFDWDGYPYYSIPSLDPAASSLLSEVRNIALAKFIQRANKVYTGSMSGETLGEWKETVRAITNPLGSLRSFVVGCVKRAKKRMRRYYENSHGGRLKPNFRSPSGRKEAAEALAGTYLEFVFGWIPLVKSINEATLALLDRFGQPEAVTVSGKGGRGYNSTNTESECYNHDYISVYRNIISYSYVEHQYRASISTGAVNGTKSVVASLGLLPEFWIPTIWELIPFSFVVDYFVNVGDIIAAMSFRRSMIRWGTSTTRVKSEFRYSDLMWRNVEPVPGYYGLVKRLNKAEISGGGAQITTKTIERYDINQVSLLPDMTIHLPYSNKAWVNMSAVLTANFCRVW